MDNEMALELEYFKHDLIKYATGDKSSDFTDKKYADVRKQLLNIKSLTEIIPEYIRKCRDLGDFWQFIKAKYSTYQERRIYLAETLNPVIEYFEEGMDIVISHLILQREKG
ncbi:Serine/threonine protein kinase (fragment) [Petrocella atlantisensis]|uniref:Serine/threonine protein kinase n=1 Tax=Petrocella atlantisensis TaxID=2173034 RepID=A0A3P7P923_9FIRM